MLFGSSEISAVSSADLKAWDPSVLTFHVPVWLKVSSEASDAQRSVLQDMAAEIERRLTNDPLYPLKCVKYSCPWDPIPPELMMCLSDDEKRRRLALGTAVVQPITPRRSVENGCICLEHLPAWTTGF